MRKSLTSVLLAAALATAVVVPILAAPRPSDRPAAGSAGGQAPAPASPSVPPGKPALSVDHAMKDLDLIRPSRPKPAQDFTLKTTDGKPFRLSEHRGKVVFLNFWATWCTPCREEMPAMERLYRTHRDKGLVMVAVSLDGDPAVVPRFVKEHNLSFTIALDPKMEAANVYGIRAVPSSFIIDAQGTMAALALGPRAWDNRAAHALIEGLIR
jgi:peroxiredoxin